MNDSELQTISPAELRGMLKISVPTYHRYLKREGGLPPRIKIGNRLRYVIGDVNVWLIANRVG